MASPPDPPTLRLLIDACVTPAVVSHLNAAFGRAVDALHVDTVLPPATADRAVLAWASQDVRIVVTSNIADFSLLARRAKGHPGLVLVEDQNTKGVQVAAVTQVLERYWRGGPPMAIRLGTCSPGEGREVGGWRFEGFHRGDVGAQRAAHSLVQNCPYFACLTSGVHSNPARALGIGIVSLNPVNPRIFGAAVMCGGTYGGRGVTIFDGGELSGRIPTR